jgi:hypothetical protein
MSDISTFLNSLFVEVTRTLLFDAAASCNVDTDTLHTVRRDVRRWFVAVEGQETW